MSNELLNGVLNGITKTDSKPSNKVAKPSNKASKPQTKASEPVILIDASKYVQSTEVAQVKELSPLQTANNAVKDSLNEKQKSLSVSFKILRTTHSEVQTYLDECVKKGKKINTDLLHDVMNVGNLSSLTRRFTDKEKAIKPLAWTSARLWNIFKRELIIKSVPTTK